MDDKHAAAYDFVQLGEGLADSLTRAAEEQVTKAQGILDQTRSMAEIIRTQVRAQAKQIEDMNGRFKAFGEQMLDAHRQLNGEPAADPGSMHGARLVTPHRVVERQEVSDLARRGSAAGAAGGAVGKIPGQIGTLDPALTRDPKRDPDANYPARTSGLPREMADLERFRANHPDRSENRNDPGTATKQPGRD